ncbi:hypothetical protein AWV79_18860 [Cupriavidus sp. UYMMa02A]|nr:hypothetical protein AWV79_18860 [Cupriavidus sp. UYMMa02A]
MAGLAGFEVDAGIEQMQRGVLGAVAEALQVDVRMPGGRAIEHGTHQIRAERREVCHGQDGHAPQQRQDARLRVTMEKRLISAHFGLDHVVIGQPFASHALVAKQLSRGLALGGGVVGAVLGDHARRSCAISSRRRTGSERVCRDMSR